MNEEWKVFKESNLGKSKVFKNVWEISTLGRVRVTNGKTGVVHTPNTYTTGGMDNDYECLSSNDFKYIHRIVAEAFIPNPDGLPCVDHINGIKHDNRLENLRWVTHSENMSYYWINKKKKKA